MPTLQQALAALAADIITAPKAAAPVKPTRAAPVRPVKPGVLKPSGPRRVALGTFGDLQPLRPGHDDEAFDRPSKSEAPPVHEPNFAERYFT